jgi:hypothetical protein
VFGNRYFGPSYFGDSYFGQGIGPSGIIRPEGPSAGHIRQRAWWQQPLLDDTPYVPPTPEEIEEQQRKADEKRARVQARLAQLADESERKELQATVRNPKRSFDDRFASAFKLATKDGKKWQ